MKKADLSKKPEVLKTVDTFLAAIPWTKRRAIIISLREHDGRHYVRLRSFNRHRRMGCWHPSPRFFMVPLDCAEALGKAIISASRGEPFGTEPEWWEEFEEHTRVCRGYTRRASSRPPF